MVLVPSAVPFPRVAVVAEGKIMIFDKGTHQQNEKYSGGDSYQSKQYLDNIDKDKGRLFVFGLFLWNVFLSFVLCVKGVGLLLITGKINGGRTNVYIMISIGNNSRLVLIARVIGYGGNSVLEAHGFGENNAVLFI